MIIISILVTVLTLMQLILSCYILKLIDTLEKSDIEVDLFT